MAQTPPTPDALRLLVPFDGSTPAARAIAIAALMPPTAVTLLHIAQDDVPAMPGAFPGDRQDEVTHQSAAGLETAAEPLRAAGHSVSVAVRPGDPAEEIVSVARDADLIVMATHGRGAASRVMFGSTADRVSRHGNTPTLLIRAGGNDNIQLPQRVVTLLDGSPLAERALAFAARIARAIDVPLHLLRAIDIDDVREAIGQGRRDGSGSGGETWEDAHRLTNERAISYLEDIATPLRETGLRVTTELLQGAPGFVLIWNTTERDLVALTSHGRQGFRRWLLGSVAEKLIREGNAPVLLVPTREESVKES